MNAVWYKKRKEKEKEWIFHSKFFCDREGGGCFDCPTETLNTIANKRGNDRLRSSVSRRGGGGSTNFAGKEKKGKISGRCQQ